jgi:non-heme chloroperoxidase
MKISVHDVGLVTTTLAAALFVATAQPSAADSLKYKPITVTTPDGLTISSLLAPGR